MAGDGGGAKRGEALGETFARVCLQPLLQLGATRPAEALAAIDDMRSRLDAVALAIEACREPAAVAARSAPYVPAPPALAPVPSRDDDRDGREDMGRNQKSRLRELILLDCLAQEAHPFTLAQLTAALAAKGYDETQATVVSQLHRMKKGGVIEQPASGLYVVTDAGIKHARKLRTIMGSLLPD